MAENDRLDRIERGIEKLETEMKEVRTELSGIRESMGRIEGALPHFATEARVEKVKGETTKALYGAIVAVIMGAGAIVSRFLS